MPEIEGVGASPAQNADESNVVNYARGRAALQSSVSQWSNKHNAEKDAAGAVNGRIDGTRKFHTALEENPWWQVDLSQPIRISEIRIYNTTEQVVRDRFRKFKISIGFDLETLVEVFRKEDDAPVGGIDSRPFIWKPEHSAWGQFVRITMLEKNYLHLDQVVVLGPAGQNIGPAVITIPNYSRIENPFMDQGFILGWEGAALGNRLSCFGNLFALGERTGVTIAYPQILTAKPLLDIDGDDYIHTAAKMPPEASKKMSELAAFTNKIFNGGYDNYVRNYEMIDLADLAELNTETGIVVFADTPRKLLDIRNFEALVKEFCGRGNGIIWAGAFWRQYMDVRVAAPHAEALRKKLRIGHEDKAGNRALAMQEAGDKCLRIGVHMRRTDYAGWYQGKYFFSVAQYADLMRKISQSLGAIRHYFCVCSDEKLDLAVFGDLPVWYEKGAQEDDFVALSRCHYVAGPPSTFGTWSAFLGRGKRLILTPERMGNIANWTHPLNDAVEVIYPTGSYLPGDPGARPI